MLNKFTATFIGAILISLSLFVSPVLANLSFGNGFYTNLNGSGTSATLHTGNNCDPSSGSCSGNTVYRFQCDGSTTDCRLNESGPSSSQSFGNPGCGKTVQLDVFDHNCRANGGWDCAVPQDYMVWYSGDCAAPTAVPTQTPRPTIVPTVIPTSIPTIVPTVIPTVIPVAVPTVANQVSCPAGFVQSLSGSTIVCVQQVQNQVQTQTQTAYANASTGPVTVNVPSQPAQVIAQPAPQVIYYQQPQIVQTLPKTGLPLVAWGLSGLLPIGLGFRKFGSANKDLTNMGKYLWEKREFLKD